MHVGHALVGGSALQPSSQLYLQRQAMQSNSSVRVGTWPYGHIDAAAAPVQRMPSNQERLTGTLRYHCGNGCSSTSCTVLSAELRLPSKEASERDGEVWRLLAVSAG